MKRIKIAVYVTFFVVFIQGCSIGEKPADSKELKLWYDAPAKVWEEALPLGNGRIGAMVFGNPSDELIQLNENTLWSGYPREMNNPKAAGILPAVREAIDRGDYLKASELWKANAQGPYSARYLPMADMHLKMTAPENVGNLYRDLNISDAISVVRFEKDGVKYKRTAFITYPYQVLVSRIEAHEQKTLSYDISRISN